MPHDEFGPVKTITVSSRELPEVAAWKNGQKYDVSYRNAKQVRRTEVLHPDGERETFVELEVAEVDGGVSE